MPEHWSDSELRAMERRDKRRIWLVELRLDSGTFRAGQSIRPITDQLGRTWDGAGANGVIEGMGSSLSRRPRRVTVALLGVRKGNSLYSRIVDAGAIGRPCEVYLAFADKSERLIVQPKLRFAGVIGKNPVVELAETDRVSLLLFPGSTVANRLRAPWDRSPASHRVFAGQEDPFYDAVDTNTQQPQSI